MNRIVFQHGTWIHLLSRAALIATCAFSLAQAAPRPSDFGVWDRASEKNEGKSFPFVRGFAAGATWDEVEKQPGVYDWSSVDSAVKKAFDLKVAVYLSFEAGPQTPTWAYEAGVPRVVTNDTAHSGFTAYPYYFSPEYKKYYTRFITEVAKHIRSYPVEMQKCIAFIQVKTGCTGDEVAYKGIAKDKRYNIVKSSKEWEDFRLEVFALYAKLFDQQEPRISLLFNDIGGDEEGGEKGKNQRAWDWVTKNITGGFGAKTGALSRGSHFSEERVLVNTWHRYLIDPQGLTVFSRSEMDQAWGRPLFQLNVQLNYYWAAINALNLGQSVWDISATAMNVAKEQGFDYSFYFFNRYAGQIYPKVATRAFCALHKGLDYSDKVAYPESEFGKASKSNVDRAMKITAAYAKYGAAIDDKSALTMGQVKQRGDQSGFNDTGWEIWPDNYTRFLYQIDADQTSVPLWRVGGPITATSPIYARFARGFEHATGKDAMYFKLHDGFSTGKPQVMTVNVVWYDANPGSSWRLDYDAGAGAMRTAQTVTGVGDKKWHHVTVTLKDAVFHQGGVKGADLALVNTDGTDDIFSLIEVKKGAPDEPALIPPDEGRAFPGYAKGTKYNKSEKSAPSDKKDKRK